MNIFQRTLDNVAKSYRRIAHIIGRSLLVDLDEFWTYTAKTYDATRPDYKWWDYFRYGKKKGYEVVGSQAHALAETVTSYVVGRGVNVALEPVDDARMQQKVAYTNTKLRRLLTALQGFLMRLYEDYYCLGDQYVVVNPDASFTVLPPNTVIALYDSENPDECTGYKVRINSDPYIITEEYRKSGKTVTIEGTDPETGREIKKVSTYPNLIGRIPLVHFANDRGPNERYGRPGYSSLLQAFSDLDDMLVKGAQGTKVAGNPLPVFENLENPDETIELNSAPEEDYIDTDDDEQEQKRIYWDRLVAIILGKGGRFKFASPQVGFANDIKEMIGITYNVLLNKSHVPPSLLAAGTEQTGEIAAARLPAWVKYIEGRRELFAGTPEDEELGLLPDGGLKELIDVWLRTKALYDKKIYVGPVVVRWSDLTERDDSLTFEKVKYAFSRGAITGVTMLRLLDLVEDAEGEWDRGQAELETRLLVEPSGDDFTGGNLDSDLSPDERDDGGSSSRKPAASSDTPREPAYGGGGRN